MLPLSLWLLSLLTTPCELTFDKGCLFEPGPTPQGLVIYFRGHWSSFRGQVPASHYQQSLQEARHIYELEKNALRANFAILILPSSHLSLTAQELNMLSERHTSYGHLLFASHSGGYKGMFDTLRNLAPEWTKDHVKALIMLDNFYSTQADNLTTLQETTSLGVACYGFTTSHNLPRFQKLYAPRGCRAQGPNGFDHNLSVKNCLYDFLLAQDCHLP